VKYFKRGLEIFRGEDLGGTGRIVPLKNLGGGTEVLLSPPPLFRKCLANLHCKRIRMKEKEDC